MALPAMASLAAMLLGLVRDCICLRRLLEDVGDGEAPNAVSKSDSLRGVELPPAMCHKLFDGEFASMETRRERERKGCGISDQKGGNHKLRLYSACL